MPRVQIIIETPALVRVGLPIIAVAAYDIEREINAAGTWVVEFPASETLTSQIRSRYRVSITEEGRPGYLLRRGIITDRQYTGGRTGDGVLRLSGLTRLYGVARQSTHLGLSFSGQSILEIASTLTGETVTAPTVPDAASRTPTVTFNETSRLAALITACEYARLSVRETFDEDSFELVSWDNVPDSGFRFVTVDQAGPDLDGAAAAGMGLIAGTPRITYNGRDLATRIIPVGVDHDGNPLTLAPIAAIPALPYAVQTGINPNGSTYWYLEDAKAVARYEVVEMQLVRSDIKNPSDNPVTRILAATALYALAAGTLIQRRSDVIAFASEIANGSQIDALPGDRVRIQFRGRARNGSFWDLDAWFLINKRRDAAATAGVRGVSFTLTAPEIPLRVPSLPNEIPIPPPAHPPPDPPDPSTGADRTAEEAKEDKEGPLDLPAAPEVPPFGEPPPAGIPPDLVPPGREPGNYQPCCPDKTTDGEGDLDPPPEDIDEEEPPVPGGGDVRAAWRNVIVTSSGEISYQNVEEGSYIRFFCATTDPVPITSDDSWMVLASNGQMVIYRGPAVHPGESGSITWPAFEASVRMCGLREDLAPASVNIQAYERPFGFGPGFAAEIDGDFEPISPDGDPEYATTPSTLGATIVP
jgi:hypothetical protein